MEQNKWGILYCPKGNASKQRQKIQAVLDQRGVEYDWVQSESTDSVERLMKMLISNGYKTIVVVGGDSALNDAVNCLMQQGGEIHPTNVVMLIAGIGLHIWAQMLCNEDSELKEQPGYPLFSVNADTHAVYEPSKVVRARAAKASDEMESIGGKKQKKSAGIAKPSEPLLSDDQLLTGLSALYENRKPGEAPAKLGPISLTTQQVQYTPPANPVPKQPAAPLPEIKLTEFKHHPQYDAHPEMLEQVDASAMLGDMTVHSKKIYNRPHEEMLPQPEEVKRRLAAMKKARQQKG